MYSIKVGNNYVCSDIQGHTYLREYGTRERWKFVLFCQALATAINTFKDPDMHKFRIVNETEPCGIELWAIEETGERVYIHSDIVYTTENLSFDIVKLVEGSKDILAKCKKLN